jgi:hypothetical protein
MRRFDRADNSVRIRRLRKRLGEFVALVALARDHCGGIPPKAR